MHRREHSEPHSEDVNWAPLSDVMTDGTPKRCIHPSNNALAQSADDTDDRGNASGHLVVLSIIVNRYVKPLLAGRGPTKSTCTWAKRRVGTSMTSGVR